MNRREFINSFFRYILLIVISLFSGYLLFKTKSEESCKLNFFCKSCQLNKKCNLEQAKKYRNDKKE